MHSCFLLLDSFPLCQYTVLPVDLESVSRHCHGVLSALITQVQVAAGHITSTANQATLISSVFIKQDSAVEPHPDMQVL